MSLRSLLCSLAVCIFLFSACDAQAQTISFQLEGQAGVGLLPGNEVGGSSSTGSGGVLSAIIFDVATNELSIDVGWGSGNGFSDMTGDATAMHIHGPADFFNNAGVLYNLGNLGGFDASASAGGLTDSITVDTADVSALLAGQFYINVHSAANPGGELRANLVQAIPEPAHLGVLGLLTACVGYRRRRS